MEFLLSNQSLFVDIPESRAQAGVALCLYSHAHGGQNQCWVWENLNIVSMLNSDLCLGVDEVVSGSPIILLSKHKAKDSHSSWKRVGQSLRLVRDESLLMTAEKDHIVLSNTPLKSVQEWSQISSQARSERPKPACSTHFTYDGITADVCAKSWELQCTVTVKESSESTYFCVVGWAPGGYSGIQEDSTGQRLAIFSMWDDGQGNNVSEVDRGKGVEVTKFGGEGEGLKSMMPFTWQQDEPITFVIKAKKSKTYCLFKEKWVCSCYFQLRERQFFLASFKRTSRKRPLHPNGFYSFIEDWNRDDGADGHLRRRRAEFSHPKLLIKGKEKTLTKLTFTKVETGPDGDAKDKAVAQVVGRRRFELCTGGPQSAAQKICLNHTCLQSD